MKQLNKKYVLFVSALFTGILMLSMASCSEDNDFGAFTPKDPDLSFETAIFNAVCRDTIYNVKINANLPWRVKSSADWIIVQNENGTADSASVRIRVTANRQQETRSGKLSAYITDDCRAEITITQDEGEPFSIIVTHYYVKATGSEANEGSSWATPTTLTAALNAAISGDIIHIAAGTYKPEKNIAGSNDPKDVSFLISENVTLEGGYPDNVSDESAVPDPANNPTILHGNKSYHCVVIVAPLEQGRKVTLKGLTVTGGEAGASAAGSVSVEGGSLVRNYGGGIITRNTVVNIEDCDIKENETLYQAAGVYTYLASTVTFLRTKIRDNVNTTTNGGGIWNDASVVYFCDSEVSGNKCWGVGAGIYCLNSASQITRTYMFNTSISNNICTGTSAAPGYYGRENSIGLMVNCTVMGNESKSDGGGIQMYSNAKLDIISSTITGNIVPRNGGGICIATATTELNLINSIVSGNTAANLGSDVYDTFGVVKQRSSIITASVYDNDSAVVPDASFDANTHLAAPASNGGFAKTCALIGENNPAVTFGMSLLNLQIQGINYDPPIPEAVIEYDQTGKSRNGKTCMGAVVK